MILIQSCSSAHPSAPNQPPLETLVGFLSAPIDKLKDEFSKFPTDEMKEEAKQELGGKRY